MANRRLGLTLSYHPESNVPLPEDCEDELRTILGRWAEVEIRPFVPRRGLPTASIIPDPLAVVLVVSGTIAATKALQLIVEDLYKLFKHRLSTTTTSENAKIRHYALILDVEADGKRYHVGIDFNDEATLTIGFFRLRVFLERPVVSDPERLTELEYPKSEYARSPIKIAISAAGAVAGGAAVLSVTAWFDHFFRSVVFDERIVRAVEAIAVFVVFLPALVFGALGGAMFTIKLYESIHPDVRSREYQDFWALQPEAHKWSLEVTPLPDAPPEATIHLEVRPKAANSSHD